MVVLMLKMLKREVEGIYRLKKKNCRRIKEMKKLYQSHIRKDEPNDKKEGAAPVPGPTRVFVVEAGVAAVLEALEGLLNLSRSMGCIILRCTTL